MATLILNRLFARQHVVEIVLIGVDDDRAGRFAGRIGNPVADDRDRPLFRRRKSHHRLVARVEVRFERRGLRVNGGAAAEHRARRQRHRDQKSLADHESAYPLRIHNPETIMRSRLTIFPPRCRLFTRTVSVAPPFRQLGAAFSSRCVLRDGDDADNTNSCEGGRRATGARKGRRSPAEAARLRRAASKCGGLRRSIALNKGHGAVGRVGHKGIAPALAAATKSASTRA